MTTRTLAAAALLLSLAGASRAQDSVPTSPGGNDALSAYDPAAQRLRYVVDGIPFFSSWNTRYILAPIAKASRDTDPIFRTQILGALATSPTVARNTGAPQSYASWSAAGAGVNPAANAAPGTITAGPFTTQFGLALSDFSLQPSNVTGLTIGFNPSFSNRFFVERVTIAASRASSGALDTSTVSLGATDAAGNVTLRADNFNTAPSTTTRVLGDNILRVSAAARSASVNALTGSGGSNSAADAAASNFILNNEPTPTNVPAASFQTAVGPWALVFDFASRFRAGSAPANLTTTTIHLAPGLTGHRGNPTFSPITLAGGGGGTVASLALRTGQPRVDTINVFGLTTGSPGTPPAPAPGTARAFTLPASITNAVSGYTANASGTSAFNQYLSQTGFRGGNGQVGIGRTATAQLVLAATATDGITTFIAAARATSPTTSTWSVVAHASQPVVNGPGGFAIGALDSVPAFSAPAVDRVGNVYFIATWRPNLAPPENGLFKAVNGAVGYELELLVSTGQQYTGLNSATPFTISQLALNDGDSIASGSLFAHALVQEAPVGGNPLSTFSPRGLGAGLALSAVITYARPGNITEAYDTVLLITPPNRCPGDFDDDGLQIPSDIFAYLNTYFTGNLAADFNADNALTPSDIFAFLNLYFAPCN